LRRFTCLTNGFSTKLQNLKAAVAVFMAWYNFCRVQFVALVAAVALTSGTVVAQTSGSVATRVRVTRDSNHIAGRLIMVDGDALTLVPDGTRDPVRIPLSSISAAEVSEGQRSQVVAELAGAGVGVGAGFVVFMLGVNANAGKAIIGALALGIASDKGIAHLIGRERWRSVPITSLASLAP
jgi:hypothetical protein